MERGGHRFLGGVFHFCTQVKVQVEYPCRREVSQYHRRDEMRPRNTGEHTWTSSDAGSGVERHAMPPLLSPHPANADKTVASRVSLPDLRQARGSSPTTWPLLPETLDPNRVARHLHRSTIFLCRSRLMSPVGMLSHRAEKHRWH